MKIYKNQDDQWCYDFTCNGKRVRRIVGLSRQEAVQVANDEFHKLTREKFGLKEPAREIPFDDFAGEFLDIYSRQNKRSWRRDETSIAHLKAYFKSRSLTGITADMIERYKAERGGIVSKSTVNRELACLKTIFTKAVEWGKTERSPAAKVKKFQEPKGREIYLTDNEMRRLIEAAGSTLRPVIIIALGTGMRKGEILGLKWENVHLHEGYILITEENSKSKKSRNVPMSGPVASALGGVPREGDFVFYNPKTKAPILDVKTAFHTAIRRAGLKKGVRFHDLRHSAASAMIRAGVDLVTVSKILGHATIQMTMRYVHASPENMKKAVDILGAMIEERPGKVVKFPVNEIPARMQMVYN